VSEPPTDPPTDYIRGLTPDVIELPDVDVVMPVRNEAEHLASAVTAVRSQDYTGSVRIFLGVGPSDDDTERIAAALAEASNDLVVVDNPSGLTPSALNLAIQAGQAPIVVRVDGHSELSDGYIRRAVATMQRTGAVNVGGLQVPVATTPFEKAVASATTSWLGTGGASYRVGGAAGPVDTVYLGVFDRAAIEAAGLFDERLIRNQDYELNIRLREAGGTVWFDPELSVGYRPRGSWSALARQYYEYGYWKTVVIQMHPESARLRQLAPPIAMFAVASGARLSRRHRWFGLIPAAYALATLGTAARAARPLVALVAPVLHASWSVGFLVGAVRGAVTGGAKGAVRSAVADRGE
jgi:succinoglycan biosynthesis protein ExoA